MSLPIQKVLHLSEAKKLKKFSFNSPYAIMEKLDGWYVYLDCIEGKWQQLSSSAGRVIPALESLSEQFHRIKSPRVSTRFIFEATIPGKPFHEMNGILNRKYEQATGVVLHLHDMIELEYYKNPFSLRYEILENNWFRKLQDELLDSVSLIPIIDKSCEEEDFNSHFSEIIAFGGEGIVLKKLNAGYSFGKRNTDVLKLKQEVTLDLSIMSYKWSKGEKGNDAMNLTLLYRKYSTLIDVVVAKHSDIKIIEDLGANIINKIAEIKAKEVLESGKLSQPTFKCFRFDKHIGE